jgi:F-type H+-transporting ATPase subunit b
MLLDINPGLIIWTIITFIVLLFVLKKMAWKPLLEALTAREEKIRESLEQAEHARHETQRLIEENQKQMQQAQGEFQRLMREAREEADKLRAKRRQEAEAEARKIVSQGKMEIEREKEAALNTLRTEVADLAIRAAGRILDEELDEKKHRKLVDSFLAELPHQTDGGQAKN